MRDPEGRQPGGRGSHLVVRVGARGRRRSRGDPGLGGAGYLNEMPAGRLLRDAKLYTIGAGTAEIRRMLIGRELTGRLDAS